MNKKEEILKKLKDLQELYPYKVTGDSSTYCSYNEAWTDALAAAIEVLEEYAATSQPEGVVASLDWKERWLQYALNPESPSSAKQDLEWIEENIVKPLQQQLSPSSPVEAVETKGWQGMDVPAWINNQLEELCKIEGEILSVKRYTSSALSIKFKSGHCYTIGVSKQSQITSD